MPLSHCYYAVLTCFCIQVTSISINCNTPCLGGTAVDRELELMRKQLPAAQKEIIGQLPTSSAVRGVIPTDPLAKAVLDAEYERLRRELGR